MPSLPRWLAVLAAALFLLTLLAGELAYRPPPAQPLTAPSDEFAAERAYAVLARILGDEAPHPLGSAANAEVRARILSELDALGLEPQVQTALVPRRGSVARVHNVLARIEGKRAGPAVLLAAHYDSVGAGPGASDDGVAVAAMLEVARILRSGPRLEHPVILLIDDGEELGLFGARAFCQQHAWVKDVAAVLNFEARGTTGASLLFETAGDDLWLMQQAAQVLPRAMTGSAFAAVYHTLPNSTDLAVFREHQLAGLNFAFIGGARRYHTPLDDLAHVDRASLQHHGDNMLALARRLANAADLGAQPPGRAVFFDVLGQAVVVLPRTVEIPFAAGLLFAWVLTCWLKRRRQTLALRPFFAALALPPLAVGVAVLLGLGLSALMIGVGRAPTPFPPVHVAHVSCYALGGVAAALGSLRWLGRTADACHLLAGVGSFAALLGAAVAFTLPGASYVCVVPAVVAWLGTVCTRRPGMLLGVFVCLVAIVAGLMLAPFFVLLPTAIGLRAGAVHAAVAAFAASMLSPALPAALGARLAPAALVCALAALSSIGLAMLAPAHDEHHPARANIVHTTLEGRPPCYFLDEDPRSWTSIPARFDRPFPWERFGLCLQAPHLGLGAPEVELEQHLAVRGKHTVKGTMRSSREAPYLTLLLPPGLRVERAALAGVKLETGPPTAGTAWRAFAFLGAEPDETIAFEVTYTGSSRQSPHVFDRTLGAPPAAARLLDARAQANAAPIHLGDGIVVAAPVASWPW